MPIAPMSNFPLWVVVLFLAYPLIERLALALWHRWRKR